MNGAMKIPPIDTKIIFTMIRRSIYYRLMSLQSHEGRGLAPQPNAGLRLYEPILEKPLQTIPDQM